MHATTYLLSDKYLVSSTLIESGQNCFEVCLSELKTACDYTTEQGLSSPIQPGPQSLYSTLAQPCIPKGKGEGAKNSTC